jgi:hypothetical protein
MALINQQNMEQQSIREYHSPVESPKICSHKNLMAQVEQSKALSRKAKPSAFLFKATKTSETTK